ncbi:hypothetical protein [Streptomyces sp. NRRL S-1448]|uniref:hypothetical protein n=1 Tax=Streptomyces sp. NRRL S-1448 TaxID=1463883 RepID=UPI000AB6DD60|nr:hypothetical protein [Streptomyces sp. NRRL S-1448]
MPLSQSQSQSRSLSRSRSLPYVVSTARAPRLVAGALALTALLGTAAPASAASATTSAASASASASAAPSRAALAQQILRTNGITLATTHVSRPHPASSARQNIVDTAHGKGALTSPWGDRPNRRVALDTRMLGGLLKLRTQYGYRIAVSEIVGGDHSTRSKHYAGLAFDITHINGRHVGSGAPHRALMAACRKLGAREVLGPGNAGHSTHVHCGWSR